MIFGYTGERINVDNIEHRVRGRLDPEHLRVTRDFHFYFCRVPHINKAGLDAEGGKYARQQSVTSTIEIIGGKYLVSGLEKA